MSAAATSNSTKPPKFQLAQHHRLLLGLLIGVIFGVALHPFNENAELLWINTHILAPVGQVFLRLIFMIVIPLLVSALVLGVLELGRGQGIGSVAKKTLLYTLIASSFSVIVGITIVDVFKPGVGFNTSQMNVAEGYNQIEKIKSNADSKKSISQTIVELIPKNPFEAAVNALNGEILALMFFALIFGLALSQSMENPKESTLVSFFEETYQVSMRIIEYAMKIAPFGVAALVFNSVFRFGADVLGAVLFYSVLVVAGLLFQQFVVYALMLKLIARRSPIAFFKACQEVYLYAFSTASSNATLPKALATAEQKLHIPKNISRFVLTIGSTANQNGTALFEGITVLFLAQVYGIELDLMQQVQVVLMSIMAGIGTAGVPGGSLPLIAILLQSLGIPVEGLGLILGVDRFLDMCRTTLNVSGDLVIAALVAGRPKD